MPIDGQRRPGRVLVLGMGRSGRAAARLARQEGYEPLTLDGQDVFPSEGVFVFAVISPGIALTHPWVRACRARGIPLRSELEFGCRALLARRVRLLAVTGSKGKSSVVKAVSDALVRAGRTAFACGNYGLPVSEVALDARLERAADAWAVVEVSSFMMETTALAPDAFVAAAILNLQQDHLDRHGSVAAYHALKRRLLTMAGQGLDFSAQVPDPALRPLYRGSYFDNPILATNGEAAVRLMRAAGLGDAQIREAFAHFEPLPYRMHELGVFGGVRCVDDSKATSLEALAAGVTMAGERVRLVAGGLEKGDDPKSVISILTSRVKKVYLIGHCAGLFHAAWNRAVDCEVCGTLERAVAKAMREAAGGDTLLLSPGTASFDQFKSFEERGEVFARLVEKEGQQR